MKMGDTDKMSKEIKFLKDWILRYIKNKDVIAKKINSIDEKDDYFVVVKADKIQKFFIDPFLDLKLDEIKEYEHNKALVCFHTRDNYKKLVEEWEKFVEVGNNFTMFFVNPFSKTERVLILRPHTHNLISDEETLEVGLKTMSENVEFTTEEEIKKIISS